MKKILLYLLLFAGMANAQIVTIPDPAFKTKLLSLGLALDSNGDGEIQVTEAQALTYLDVSDGQITDMTGIEAFVNLTTLICIQNQITSLDLTALTNLQYFYAYSNVLSSVNISGLTNLKEINCDYNQLTSLDVAGMTTITSLSCVLNHISSLNVSGLVNLVSLTCNANQIPSLNLAGMTSLETLQCSGNLLTSLNISGLTSLKTIDCAANQIPTLDVGALTALQSLRCYSNNVTSLALSALTNLTYLDCGYNYLTALDVSGLVNLEHLDCTHNQIAALSVTGLTSLDWLNCASNQITTLDPSTMTNLIFLDCGGNLITSLDTSYLTNLESLSCSGDNLGTLNVSNLVNLKNLNCSFNQLTTLDVSALTQLEGLACSSNSLTSLDLSNNTNLTGLDCSINQLSTLDVSNLTQLYTLNYGNNNLPNLDFSGLTQLHQLYLSSTFRTSLDVSNQPLLTTLSCSYNPIPVVDVSNQTQLIFLYCGSASLQELYMKNGVNEIFSLAISPSLEIVCVDQSQLASATSEVMNAGGYNAIISSYCTLVPGGDYNTITGLARFDLTNNGCSDQDVSANNLRFNINDGTITEASLVNLSAGYGFYTGAGDFTVTPQFENPDYFNVSPTSAVFNFPALDNSTQTQNFCVTANGVHPDLEIVLVPLSGAIPGFDAQYQIVYKNKGNQIILAGNINLNFDDARTDFLSATPDVDNQAVNSLTWDFENLQPFETRAIVFSLNLNSPVESPALNQGDLLDFTANVAYAGTDDTPADNETGLQQLVTNSMDPNAKTCLEGDIVSPTLIGDYLHYNIEFENLGTAEATNVVVKDVIDTTMYDISTLQVLYSSNFVRTSIVGNTVEFIFEGINLSPAAGDPPVGGHGNVLFKIKTLSTLAVGTQVKNTAEIFFDYNSSILTNEARTAFETLAVPENHIDQSIVLFPNPAKDHLTINCSGMIRSVDLYDVQGRILQSTLEHTNSLDLDISNKANGIYFVKITTANGAKVEKIVKE